MNTSRFDTGGGEGGGEGGVEVDICRLVELLLLLLLLLHVDFDRIDVVNDDWACLITVGAVSTKQFTTDSIHTRARTMLIFDIFFNDDLLDYWSR